MKFISRNLSHGLESIKIYPLGDLHIGSPKCNIGKLKGIINDIATHEDSYCVLLGDIIDNATTASVGDTYSAAMTPMEQIEFAAELFMPIKDKILAITAGNHERRTMRSDGIDLVQFLALKLGLEDIYDYASVVLRVRVGRNKKQNIKASNSGFIYTMYLAHGDGSGGMTTGAKANALQKRGDFINTDVIVLGHQHQPLTFFNSRYEVDLVAASVRKMDQLCVMTCSFLDYETYADVHGMRPQPIAMPIIMLSGTQHQLASFLINI